MKVGLLYRIVSVLLLLFAVGHTLRISQDGFERGVDSLIPCPSPKSELMLQACHENCFLGRDRQRAMLLISNVERNFGER